MYPLIKTFISLKMADLRGLIIACGLLAVIVVIAAVVAVTSIGANLVNLETQWLDKLITWLFGILTGIGGWFMLPSITVLISGMFQEKVIHRVELVYYPGSIRSEAPKFWPDIVHDIKFTLLAIFLNLTILPLYLVGIGFAASILLNSYLLGREFFESAAGYHLGKARARELGRNNKAAVLAGGLTITLMTLVPLLNIIVPIVAIVWMAHLFHKIDSRQKQSQPI